MYLLALVHLKVGPAEKNSEALQFLKEFWNNISLMPMEHMNIITKGAAFRSPFVAAEMGNTGFLIELIRLYPDLIWNVDDSGQSIFHIAVKHRHEKIYNLLHDIGSMKDFITALKDYKGNNMLHLLGEIPMKNQKQDLPGVALEMQHEILWYKEVEQMIPPPYRVMKNEDGKAPYELFTENHKKHVEDGEKWMKATASQCMVVAALIATIIFASAFTLPLGYNKDTGVPSFHKNAFMVFVISNAISLVLSSTSIITFVSILTSSYGDNAFRVSLPGKLIFGLATLILSVVTMMVSFSASFFVLYHTNMIWVPILVTAFAAMPVVLFPLLQFPLLMNMFRTTYRSSYLFQPNPHVLHFGNHGKKNTGCCVRVAE